MTKEPSPQLEQFAAADKYGTLYSASVQIALYSSQPLEAIGESAVACYRLFMARYGADVDQYHAENMRQSRAFSQKYADVFPTLCQAKDVSLPRYTMSRGKDDTHDFLPPVFHTTAYHEFSVLELDLPPEVAEKPGELMSWVTELAEAFPFRCSTVGYSLCWDDSSADRGPVVPNLIAPFYKRYPGFAWATPREIADHPLPPVNWLTLLGPEVIKKLGGIKQVRKDLKDDAISVQPMGAGLCIRAGEAPQLGDRNRGDDLPLYRKVGSYLKPYRGNEYIEFDGFDAHGSEAWLARFDD